MQNTTNKDDRPDWVAEKLPLILKWIGIAAVVLAIAAICAYLWRFHDHPVAADPGSWGELGDFFGGVLNPAFSFLALVALLMTLFVQSRELRLSRRMAELSRQELEMTRLELEKSAEALAAQNDAINHQRFEQTFFAWLDSYRALVSTKVYRQHILRDGKINVFHGLEAFSWLYSLSFDPSKVFRDLQMSKEIPDDRLISSLTESEQNIVIRAIADRRRRENKSGVLHAPISSLVALAEWIVKHHSSSETTLRQYFVVLRSQLSIVEQRVLLVASIGDEWPSLQMLIESYGLLDPDRLRGDGGHDFLWTNRELIKIEMRNAMASSGGN